ncbi:hypothetical protein F4560_000142 [Saccharothrix ecbatanensis]|uniref:Uncharacterized protein n=1 Tax=Saccharothrix ecbatanensis TaxID=1105145 RepID=A0A7W9HDP5_9PSEU|nr:hypothetical protein [Saccharothrix ecbatanensis]MBB5800374.1 hypothetical protein [Saccharothrix ecbatanensis]
MTESFITAEDIEELFAKLDEVELNDPQRALLSAILKVAGDVTDVTDLSEESEESEDKRSFSDQFATSFTPHQAALIVEYVEAPAGPSLISRVTPPCPPLPAGSATPALISRLISRNVRPDSSQP